jgi:hypothetical protein
MEIYGPKLGPCQILEPLSFNNPSYLRKVSRPKATNQEGFYYTRFGQYANSPPTFTGVGHQWTISRGHCKNWFSQWEPLVAITADTHRSLMAHTNRCGWAISYVLFPWCTTMYMIWEQWIGRNRLLVTDEPVVEAQDFRKITHRFRGI